MNSARPHCWKRLLFAVSFSLSFGSVISLTFLVVYLSSVLKADISTIGLIVGSDTGRGVINQAGETHHLPLADRLCRDHPGSYPTYVLGRGRLPGFLAIFSNRVTGVQLLFRRCIAHATAPNEGAHAGISTSGVNALSVASCRQRVRRLTLEVGTRQGERSYALRKLRIRESLQGQLL